MIEPGTSQGGIPTKIENANGTIINPATGFAIPPYDTIVPDYTGSTVDVYTYLLGGLSGTTVATLTINYTDSTKAVMASIIQT
jgi:hypothetical protein